MVSRGCGKSTTDRISNTRRKALKSLGAASIGLIAGCSGDNGDGDGSDGGGSDGGGGDSGGSDGDGSDGGDDVDYPEREIEVIIPYGPGGGTDTYGRFIAKHLPKHLPNDVNVVARNVEGAGGVVATNEVYNSDPDGYTIQQGHLESQTMSQLLPSIDVEFDIRDFVQLASSADATRCWYGNADIIDEYDNWDALAEGLRTGELQVPTGGRGSSHHVATMLYGELTGDYDPNDVQHVHYDGFGETIPPLIRGDQHITFGTFSTARAHAEEEENISVAMVLDEEYDGPYSTQQEFGVPEDVASQTEVMFTNVRAIWGPPDLPDTQTEILREALWETLHDDELLDEAEEADRPIIPREGEEVQDIAQEFYERWSDHIDLLEEAGG